MLLLAADAPATATGAPAESPAWVIARQNLARVRTSPSFKSGPEPEFSDEAKAAGEIGTVMLRGVIGTDGRFTELSVLESSRSARLDNAAMVAAAATIFEPARDAAGEPISVVSKFPVEFSNARSPGKGGGVLRYRCDQFVRDYDWWAKTWPSNKHDEFYLMTLGVTTMALSMGMDGRIDYQKFGTVNQNFDQRWKAAAEACRSKPAKLFIDVFKPEGDMLRRLAGG